MTLVLLGWLIAEKRRDLENAKMKGPIAFDLILQDVVEQTGNIELVTVTFEHWQKQTVSTSILEPGPLGAVINQYIPSVVMSKLVEQGWNQSSAEIITSCMASVEFEIPIDSPEWKEILIDGDTATITAPSPVLGELNIRPESLRGWVLREDFLIDGKKEKSRLLKHIRPKLRKKVESREFTQMYREQCRRSLEQFFRQLLSHIKRCDQVNHVYVHFSDEPSLPKIVNTKTESE